MPFPSEMVLVPVEVTVEGVPDDAECSVTFECFTWQNSTVHDTFVPSFKEHKDIGVGGGTTMVALPATNAPDWLPVGWTYAVTVQYGNKFLKGAVAVPYDSAGFNLSDVMVVDGAVAPGETYIPLSQRGQPDGVATLDEDGLVPEDQLPPGSSSADWSTITGKPATFPPSAHVHTIAQVTDLQTQLDGKQAAGTYLVPSDITNLVSTESMNEGLALKAPIADPTFTGTVSGVSKTAVGLGNVDNTSDANKPVSTAQGTAIGLKANSASPTFTGTVVGPTPSVSVNSTQYGTTAHTWAVVNDQSNRLTTGEEVMPRDDVAGEVALVSGVVYWSFFTARKTETITQCRTATGSTAAAGLTLARIGVYSTNGTTLTLVASTANDTSLWTVANTMTPKTFSASFGKVAGTRYAMAYLAIGTTMPTLEGVQIRPNSVALPPRIQGELSGQTDLPASQLESGLSGGFRRFQGIILP